MSLTSCTLNCCRNSSPTCPTASSSSVSSFSAVDKILSKSTSSGLTSVNMFLAPNLRMEFNSSLVKSVLPTVGPCIPKEDASKLFIKQNSNILFLLALSIISSSIVSFAINRYTVTAFVCPILCDLAIACKSFCGLKSLSYMITLLAAVSVNPNPPALVLNKNMKSLLSSALNLSTALILSVLFTLPSSLWNLYLFIFK
eukprot:NODE_116_length_19003_cov_0.233707.p10 type:complete len:199 gc:universal NODE_116_length_19003_cov_0.233707:12639-13235(+)